jgi:dihydroflavonol-4-reductase
VTAANGFIGSAIVRALIARDIHVVAMMDPGSPQISLSGLPVEEVMVGVLDSEAMSRAFDGARIVVHVAPDYRFVSRNPSEFQSINVEGTRRVLSAARAVGCEKVVYTSSVGTLSLYGTSMEKPADESNAARFDHLDGFYRQSKYSAEHEVLRVAAEGLPVTLILPTTPLGPYDFAPTPSGRIVLDFLNGSSGSWFDTALNLVDVDDLASGYLLALERGGIGRSYILGGKNLDFKELYSLLTECTGLRHSGFRLPRRVAMTAAHLSEIGEGRILRREPSIPIEGVRLATRELVFSDKRARAELGYHTREAIETIDRAAHWFAESGLVDSKRVSRIHWRGAST